jgi:hypothetical protein
MAKKSVAPKTNFTDPKANSFADKLLRFELLESKLVPLLDTMPHIKPVHAELVQLIANAKDMEFEIKSRRANYRQAIADRKALIKTGEGIRSRLASALAFEHGATSVLLTEFGLRPRKAGGRRKKASPPPTPAPQTQPETPTPVPTGTPTAPQAVGSEGGKTAQ